jgi:hypothetical protein
MAVQEVQWSDVARDARRVAALADEGDVRLKRRDGADLLLTREDRAASVGEGSFAAARALRNVLAHMSISDAVRALADEFPWLSLLPADDQQAFVSDFARAAQVAAELGRWEILAQEIREWKATAAIYADPDLARQLKRPLTDEDEFIPAPPPVQTETEA